MRVPKCLKFRHWNQTLEPAFYNSIIYFIILLAYVAAWNMDCQMFCLTCWFKQLLSRICKKKVFFTMLQNNYWNCLKLKQIAVSTKKWVDFWEIHINTTPSVTPSAPFSGAWGHPGDPGCLLRRSLRSIAHRWCLGQLFKWMVGTVQIFLALRILQCQLKFGPI